MQTIKQLYRSSYEGEDMITQMTHRDNQWVLDREFVPNRVISHQISNRAVILGNGLTREKFDVGMIMRNKGGLLGATALQTYGCNAFYRDYSPNFTVAVGDAICSELAESGFCDDHIVYANAKQIVKYPGKFYLIPQDPSYNSGSLATYLACFDGHKKIYLVGFDNSAGEGYNNNVYAGTNAYESETHNYSDQFWVLSMEYIMKTYSDVEFIRVMPHDSYRIPDAWRSLTNFRQIDFFTFGLEADL